MSNATAPSTAPITQAEATAHAAAAAVNLCLKQPTDALGIILLTRLDDSALRSLGSSLRRLMLGKPTNRCCLGSTHWFATEAVRRAFDLAA